MKLLTSRKLIGTAALVLLLGLSVSSSALGQGRGRGHGHGGFDNFDKKCGKFVNCHDARDGRLDGRGPNRNRFVRNRAFMARGTRVGFQRRYNMNDYWQRRHLTYGTRDPSNRWRYRGRIWRDR